MGHLALHNAVRGRGAVLDVQGGGATRTTVDLGDRAPLVTTTVVTLRIQEQGTADNAFQTAHLHATINANGEITATRLDLGPVACRG